MPESAGDKYYGSGVLDLVGPFSTMRGRIPSMDVFRERFFRLSRTAFFQKFRRNLLVEEDTLEIRAHDEYINSIQTPSLFAIWDFAPLRGFVLFQMSGQMMACIVDDLYGAGGMKTEFKAKELSTLEMRMANILSGVFAGSLADTFEAYVPVTPHLVRTETHTTLATIADSKDPLVVMSATFGSACGVGQFSVAVPYVAIEPYKEAFGASVSMSIRRDDDERWKEALSARLDEAPLTISVEIASLQLSLGRLSKLKVGDVLPLPLNNHSIVKEKNVQLAKAVIGATDDGVAFQCV